MRGTLCVQVDLKTCSTEEPLNSLIIEKHLYLSCPVMVFLGKSALPSFQLPPSGSLET